MTSCRLSCAILALVLLPTFLLAGEVEIVHIRVGQGDATLTLRPADSGGDRVSVLIDAGDIPFGGGYDGGRVVGAVLSKWGVNELDFCIATHYDADHIGGMVAGESHMHGHSFILGPNGTPGAEGDDDSDGRDGWLDSSLTRTRPDPEELGRGDDIRIATFVDRGDSARQPPRPPLSTKRWPRPWVRVTP